MSGSGINTVGRAFMRGARPTPRHKLLAATPHVFKAPPPQFAYVPNKLDMWGNDRFGDCVSAEEAFAKACYSTEIFIDANIVTTWASKNGFLNGANLTDVMDVMKSNGFKVGSQQYNDGGYSGVDYSNESILQSAIAQGPVKIAIDANALPSGAGNNQGWYATGGSPGQFGNTDHCVALCGYGPTAWLFQQLNVPMPAGLPSSGYLLYTWSTIGFVDHAWIMSTVTEAWVRNPTTVGNPPLTPPTPPPLPPPPGPGPGPTPIPVVGSVVVLTLPDGGTVNFPAVYTPALTPSPAPVNQVIIKDIADLDAALTKLKVDSAKLPHFHVENPVQQQQGPQGIQGSTGSQGSQGQAKPSNKGLGILGIVLSVMGINAISNGPDKSNGNTTANSPKIVQTQTGEQLSVSPKIVANKQVPPGCDCKVCDCPVCDGANCGPITQQTTKKPDAKFTPSKDDPRYPPDYWIPNYWDAVNKTPANPKSTMVTFVGMNTFSVPAASVVSKATSLPGFPDQCVVVSRWSGDRWYYVTTIVNPKPESIARAIELPIPQQTTSTSVVVTARNPGGHTHTCPRCGTTWDHATNPSHNCPNCGTQQLYQDQFPKMVEVRNQPIQFQSMQAVQGGCANGSCSTPARVGLFRR